MSHPKTLFEKVWEQHLVAEPANEPALLYIDLHLVNEVTSPQAFDGLRMAGRKLRRADRTVATVDHNVPTTPGIGPGTRFHLGQNFFFLHYWEFPLTGAHPQDYIMQTALLKVF